MQNEAFWNCVGAISIRGFRIVATCSVNGELFGVLTWFEINRGRLGGTVNPHGMDL